MNKNAAEALGAGVNRGVCIAGKGDVRAWRAIGRFVAQTQTAWAAGWRAKRRESGQARGTAVQPMPARNDGRHRAPVPAHPRTLAAWLRKLAPLLLALPLALPLTCAAQPQDMARYKEVMKDREEILTLLRGTARIEETDFPNAIQFVDEQRGIIYLVTKQNHPAHPAMVTRRLAEENGKPVMKMDSESGGNRAAFQRWLAELAASDKATLEGTQARASAPPPAPPSGGEIEYKTVQQALASLRAKPGAQARRDEEGWITISEQVAGNTVLWTFVPQAHPAYPAGVKRTILERGGSLYIDMRVLCEAQKAACDKLVREFQALNERMRREVGSGGGR